MEDVLKRNNVKVIGAGQKTLLFVHGFIGDQDLWRFVVPSFTNEYRIVLFDFMGSGKFDPAEFDSKKYSTLQGYADDVLGVCASLQLHDVIFVGHSIASMIGLIACIQEPRYFKSMIFVAPSPSFINDGNYVGGFERGDIDQILNKIETDYATWAKQIAPAVINAPDRPELANELVHSLLTRDQQAARLFASATFFADYRKELLKLKIPTLIIQCSEDMMAPLQVGDYLHAHLVNSHLEVLKVKGHFPQLSAPQELTSVIQKYLV